MNHPSISPVRLAIIGTGIVARLHIDAIVADPNVELVAVCDLDEQRASDAAARSGARAWQDFRHMLIEERLDGVIITSPHALHVDMALAAAEAGVAVLVEKPIATSLADADRIIDACRRAGVALAVGHVLRFDPSAQAAASVIESGRLGHPLAISHRRSAHYTPGSRPEWFFDPVLAGGGIAVNVGPHGIDRIQWFGGGRVSEVTAEVWMRGDLRVETDVLAFARLDSGVTANLTLISAELGYVDETIVVCERGSLRYSAADGVRVAEQGDEQLLAEPAGDASAFSAQLADFADAVRRGRDPLVNGEYGRSVLATVLGIYESSATHAPVTLPTTQGEIR